VVRGRWRDDSGRLRWVEACGLHVSELDEVAGEGQRFVSPDPMGIRTD
jgi:hypothetical protein